MVITRCPDCHARFRVTDGQLMLAGGQVRCGACLSVFDAQAHALQPPSQPPATVAPAPAVTANATPANTIVEPPVEASTTPDSKAFIATEAIAPATPTAAPASPPLPFRAEPIALHSNAIKDSSPLATAGWLLLSLCATLMLAVQLLWFERAHLASRPELHSIYALLCEQVDCSLTRNTLNLIENQGLHVQPHPQYRDALSVSLLLENTAAFSQPWPALQLRFTDLKERLVAQRTFQPEEYLDTASIDPLRMPTGQPVQIALELASPGRRGVSYELKLVPARQTPAK
ncbi:putative Zn finger-like uncharacterized protein [Marinobacterium halophilum]|uniref:Putative Zn finger-like uncharacterized protein n=1 Tax=Marinobacterium halophilum TaxID=267374 RepID=A0A2P8F1C2_9GAMM|nr:DUF3426 domain-containing protein [Marinobacterium halophilum]PSL15523.1 putative Zn finger-like uncharacterized protein [Marinobacterium halophilum]